jgi:(p)ppGpp synthase/HD superfamily hydrolase
VSLRELVGKAARIAAQAHETQTDKSGEAYILHPLRMTLRCRTDAQRIVALLHDVVEDSPMTLERLGEEGFPPEIIAGIDGMTHRDGESYEAFVDRAAQNPLAAYVKRLDLADNMDMLRLLDLTDKDIARLQKYYAAYRRLRELAE